jgi:hypothetical protein
MQHLKESGNANLLNGLVLIFCFDAGDGTQGLAHVKYVFCYFATPPPSPVP